MKELSSERQIKETFGFLRKEFKATRRLPPVWLNKDYLPERINVNLKLL